MSELHNRESLSSIAQYLRRVTSIVKGESGTAVKSALNMSKLMIDCRYLNIFASVICFKVPLLFLCTHIL